MKPDDADPIPDHLLATGIIFFATSGDFPHWATSMPEFLAKIRGCSVERARGWIDNKAEPAMLLAKIRAVASKMPEGYGFNWPATLGAIAGWDEPRATAALKAAQEAGLLSGGPPQMLPGIDKARKALLALHEAISEMRAGLAGENVLTLEVIEQFSEILHGAKHADDRTKRALGAVLATQITVGKIVQRKELGFSDAEAENAAKTGADTARWRCPCEHCETWRKKQAAPS
jgi:hypothetical protein